MLAAELLALLRREDGVEELHDEVVALKGRLARLKAPDKGLIEAYIKAVYGDAGAILDETGRIDALFFCPHTAAEGCGCRKPRTGMFEEIAARAAMAPYVHTGRA